MILSLPRLALAPLLTSLVLVGCEPGGTSSSSSPPATASSESPVTSSASPTPMQTTGQSSSPTAALSGSTALNDGEYCGEVTAVDADKEQVTLRAWVSYPADGDGYDKLAGDLHKVAVADEPKVTMQSNPAQPAASHLEYLTGKPLPYILNSLNTRAPDTFYVTVSDGEATAIEDRSIGAGGEFFHDCRLTTVRHHHPFPSATPTGAPAAEVQSSPGWGLDRIDERRLPMDGRYRTSTQGAGVTVYVIDGLVDVSNPEFEGRASVGLDLFDGQGCTDHYSMIPHGTFVAGIIAGKHTGVAKDANIVSLGATNCGMGPKSEHHDGLVRGLNWVADNGVRPAVVNLSQGWNDPSPEMRAALKRVWDAGFLVVIAVGNKGEDACKSWLNTVGGPVTVGASTEEDKIWRGSNTGRCVNLFAPGYGVRSVVPASVSPDRLQRDDAGGTSWAAPYVTGAAALYLSQHPKAGPQEVRQALLDSATQGALKGRMDDSPNRLLYTGDLS